MAKPPVKITTPTAYRGFILRPRSDGGMDLIDPRTHRWAAVPTQRFAKWSASWMMNITARFNEEAPLREIPLLSDTITRVATERGIPVVDVPLPEIDPSALRGFPVTKEAP